jgi:hypothetical protein
MEESSDRQKKDLLVHPRVSAVSSALLFVEATKKLLVHTMRLRTAIAAIPAMASKL